MFFKLLAFINFKRLGVTFASIFGSIWLFLEPAGLFLPEWLNWGWEQGKRIKNLVENVHQTEED